SVAIQEEPVPTGPWFRSRVGIPSPPIQPRPPQSPAAGLRALGPPPDGMDLVRPLLPLYEAGASTAIAIALGEGSQSESAFAGWKRKRIRASTAQSGETHSFSARGSVETSDEAPRQE